MSLADVAGDFQPATLRQRNIENAQVPGVLPQLFNGFGSRSGFTDFGYPNGFRDDGSDPRSHEQVCVANQEAHQSIPLLEVQPWIYTLQYVS
jgi:hypothetical protein